MSKLCKETNLMLRALQDGNNKIWGEFYDFTYDYLKIIAYKYVYYKPDWQDVVHQTYLQILRRIKTFDRHKDGYNWICKIAHNIALDFNKQRIPTVDIDSIAETYFADIDYYMSDSNGLLHELSKLDIDDQRLIWLRFWEDCTYRRIAELTHSKKSTVCAQIKVILKNLEEKLK